MAFADPKILRAEPGLPQTAEPPLVDGRRLAMGEFRGDFTKKQAGSGICWEATPGFSLHPGVRTPEIRRVCLCMPDALAPFPSMYIPTKAFQEAT